VQVFAGHDGRASRLEWTVGFLPVAVGELLGAARWPTLSVLIRHMGLRTLRVDSVRRAGGREGDRASRHGSCPPVRSRRRTGTTGDRLPGIRPPGL
jgi:hypothetical protein